MIKIKNLSVSFSNNAVLVDISVDLQPNQIYGIVGLNGSGKTTFFNALSKSIQVTNGYMEFNGNPISDKDIGYLESVNFFYSRITGNEYLKIFSQTNPSFNLNSLQNFFKLPLDDLIETYSTGMKKKLALLGLLKKNRSIFLLDEPFNGLDLESNKILELIITALKEKEKTLFISSHIIDPLLKLCDVILILENGKFAKIVDRQKFNEIEDELFKKFNDDTKIIISNSI